MFCSKVHSNAFLPFSKLFPFLLESKINDLIFCLTKQLRYTTCGLETCCLYLEPFKHTYISIVKQTISTLQVVLRSFFFFLFRGAQ